MAELKKRYDLTGGGDLQWFLGIEIIRDRRRGYTLSDSARTTALTPA